MKNFDEMTDQEINGMKNIDGTLQKSIISIVRKHKMNDSIMYNSRKTLAADRADLMRRRRKLQKYPLKKIAADFQ